MYADISKKDKTKGEREGGGETGKEKEETKP